MHREGAAHCLSALADVFSLPAEKRRFRQAVEKSHRKISHFNAIKHWTKGDNSGKLFVGKKIGMCQLSKVCSVGLFYIEKCGAFRFSDEQYCRFVKEVEGFCYTLI